MQKIELWIMICISWLIQALLMLVGFIIYPGEAIEFFTGKRNLRENEESKIHAENFNLEYYEKYSK